MFKTCRVLNARFKHVFNRVLNMTKTFILFNCFHFGYRYFQVPKIAKKTQVILCNLAEDITKIPDALLVLIPSSAGFVLGPCEFIF